MSLIGEALKKAHLEAIRQDSSRGGLVHTPGVAQYRQAHARDKRTWTTTLIVSNVLLALVVAAVVMWITTGDDRNAAAATAAVGPSAERPAASTSPSAGDSTSARGESGPITANEPVEVTSASASVPAAAGPDVSDSRTGVSPMTPATEAITAPVMTPPITRPAQETVAPAPVRTALSTVDGLVSGQTYMRSVPVPGGADLVLSGMSVAGGRGVALINSRMVREGDRVGPFLVGSIADRKVALEYKGITVYLKMP